MRAARYARRMSERSEVLERVVAAYRGLGELGETVEDEWQYVTDLVEAYSASLADLAGGPPLSVEQIAAIDEAIAEIETIEDPHRAIDWLSTFPHVVAIAIGGDVDADLGPAAPVPGGSDEPDDDNPFAALLRGKR